MENLKTIKEKEMRFGDGYVSIKRKRFIDSEKDDFISITTGVRHLCCSYPKKTIIIPVEKAHELSNVLNEMARPTEKVYELEIPITLKDNYINITVKTEETDKYKIMKKAIETAKMLEKEREWDVDREVLHEKPLSCYVKKQKRPKSIKEILDSI